MSAVNPYLEKLVDLYANSSVEDVEKKPELTEAAMGKLQIDDELPKWNNFVKELRRDFVNYSPLESAIGPDLVAKSLVSAQQGDW